MSVRQDILTKALACIDEVYPESDAGNASFFPTDEQIDEAAEWVARAVPLHALGQGAQLPTDELEAKTDGSGSVPMPDDFCRLIRFRVNSWSRPVSVPIRDTDARYAQQFNPTLRGGDCRPVVVLCENTRKIEYFSSSKGKEAKITEAHYFPFTTVDENYPARLIDITAWKVAEQVATVMNDTAAIQVAAGKVQEKMQML